MSRILAVDTSTDMSTIALVDNGVLIGSAEHTDARGHVEAMGTLFAQIPEVDPTLPTFRAPDLIVCGVGPGPFTGLRVGIAFGETLAFAWNIPIVGVCSLDAVALNILRTAQPASGFIAATEARRGEYYWATYSEAGKRMSGPQVTTKEIVESQALPLLIGFHPLGIDLAACIGQAEELPITPLYLRAPDAQPGAAHSGVLT